MQDFRELIKVNGTPVRLQPYTELRHIQIAKVDVEINEFIDKNPDLIFSAMERSKKAYFWKKKAQILWEPQPEIGVDGEVKNLIKDHWDSKEKFFTQSFFEDSNFEYPLLQKTQVFFLNQEVFL